MIRDYCGYEICQLTEGRAFGGIGVAQLPFQVDIEKFSNEFDKRASFDPEIKKTKTKFLTFCDPIKFGDKGTCHVYPNGVGNFYHDRILIGGGGGCCDVIYDLDGSNGQNRGFYVFEFDESGDLTQPYDNYNSTIFTLFNYSDCSFCSPEDTFIIDEFGFCVNTNFFDFTSTTSTTINGITTTEDDTDSGNKWKLKTANVFVACVVFVIVRMQVYCLLS